MSRIGYKPITVPKGVKIAVQGNKVNVEGPKGKLSEELATTLVTVSVKDENVSVDRANEEKQTKAFHGLYRNLINNMVIGVTEGFKKSLVINGVGFKAEVQGKLLVLSLGYSSDVYVGIPDGLIVGVEANNQKVVISGIDKQLVGQFASEIRGLRKPEPYKGKGIRYETETIRKKVGKTGVK
ncbi:MAG: 50S ribosomal protein L6 [Spirochaetae bacterium HGW-Spirochaetae-7]|jgi:large subunit ribosomal protein L6|nr:MAG: 50S ribosomal protein L6 [Spirochaetae bacterium HGW-Spirochaetae-7]